MGRVTTERTDFEVSYLIDTRLSSLITARSWGVIATETGGEVDIERRIAESGLSFLRFLLTGPQPLDVTHDRGRLEYKAPEVSNYVGWDIAPFMDEIVAAAIDIVVKKRSQGKNQYPTTLNYPIVGQNRVVWERLKTHFSKHGIPETTIGYGDLELLTAVGSLVISKLLFSAFADGARPGESIPIRWRILSKYEYVNDPEAYRAEGLCYLENGYFLLGKPGRGFSGKRSQGEMFVPVSLSLPGDLLFQASEGIATQHRLDIGQDVLGFKLASEFGLEVLKVLFRSTSSVKYDGYIGVSKINHYHWDGVAEIIQSVFRDVRHHLSCDQNQVGLELNLNPATQVVLSEVATFIDKHWPNILPKPTQNSDNLRKQMLYSFAALLASRLLIEASCSGMRNFKDFKLAVGYSGGGSTREWKVSRLRLYR